MRDYIHVNVEAAVDMIDFDGEDVLKLLSFHYAKKTISRSEVFEAIDYNILENDIEVLTLDDRIKLEIMIEMFHKFTVAQLQEINDRK